MRRASIARSIVCAQIFVDMLKCKNIVVSIFFISYLCMTVCVHANISLDPGIHISFGNPLAGQLVLCFFFAFLFFKSH